MTGGSDGPAVLPVIDVGPLVGRASDAARAGVAGQIQAACRERGFLSPKVFPQLRRNVLEQEDK